MKAGHTLYNTLGHTLKSLSVFFQDLKKVSESEDIYTYLCGQSDVSAF